MHPFRCALALSALALSTSFGCGLAKANHAVDDARDHAISAETNVLDSISHASGADEIVPASADQVELTTPCVVAHGDELALGYCTLDEARADTSEDRDGEWYCTARSGFGRAFNGQAQTREAARAAALDECQNAATFCYVSRCRGEVSLE